MHWETKKFMWLTLLQWFGTKPTLSPVYASISEKTMAPHSSTLAWKIHGKRSLVGCSPWGREESDMTEWLRCHFSLSCTGEGHGNPLHCSCLENPRDGRAWRAVVYGVAQSRTWLKRFSSSSRAEGSILMLVRACMHYFSTSSKAGNTLAFLLACPDMDQKGGGSGGTWNLYVIKYKKMVSHL